MSILSSLRSLKAIKKVDPNLRKAEIPKVSPTELSPAAVPPKVNLSGLKPVNVPAKVNLAGLKPVVKSEVEETLTRSEVQGLNYSNGIKDVAKKYGIEITPHESAFSIRSKIMSKAGLDKPNLQPIENDTRGQGRFFHGASSEVKKVRADMYTTQNIYGQGFYTTDAMDIAGGYTKKGTGGTPTMHEIDIPDVKIKSMEEPLDEDFLGFASGAVKDDLLDAALDEDPKNLRELYNEVRDLSADMGVSADEVQSLFDTIQQHYTKKGFGAFEHKGGLKTGKKEHTVRIYFPESKVNIRKLEEAFK